MVDPWAFVVLRFGEVRMSGEVVEWLTRSSLYITPFVRFSTLDRS